MELLERVIKIEATLPSLASKSDVDMLRNDMSHMATKVELQALRADFHRDLNMQTWRLIGVCGALVATTYFIATHFGH
ncbi:MAG: hypothetical protein QM537_06035 [Candidatus Symbiobacter sp.]|nr:hypothetical protein [Candidatus Symbiobacter sp.]